jgi:hypothetical protein
MAMTEASPTRRRWFQVIGLVPAVLLLLAALLISGVWFAVSCVKNQMQLMHDCYCIELAACVVIEYMRENEGRWPREWEDLNKPYATASKAFDDVWSFDEVQSRVDIDWSADPGLLKTATSHGTEPPFKVIWLRNGQRHNWSGGEPNQLILEYLKTGKSPIDNSPQGSASSMPRTHS